MRTTTRAICILSVLLLVAAPVLAAGARERAEEARRREADSRGEHQRRMAESQPAAEAGDQPAAAAATPATPATPAAAKKEPKAKGKTVLDRGEWAKLAPALKLTDEQREQFIKLIEERDAATMRHGQQSDARTQELNRQLKSARGNKQQTTKIKAEMKEIKQAGEKIQSDCKDKMLAALSADQKAAWESYDLNGEMTQALKRAKLTTQQQAKVQAKCDVVAKAQVAGQYKDAAAYAKAKDELKQSIVAEVLTDAQRAKIKAKAAPAAATAAPAPATPDAAAPAAPDAAAPAAPDSPRVTGSGRPMDEPEPRGRRR